MKKDMYELKIAHLYGDLMNTYGDYGNILILKYYGKRLGIKIDSKVVSLENNFKASDYDLAILGDGQPFEQSIVAKDLPHKKVELMRFINKEAPMIAVGSGYQLLGKYYIDRHGYKVPGAGLLDHYSIQDRNTDLVGNIKVINSLNHEEYHGFEHHRDYTFLGNNEQPLGRVITGQGGNNPHDDTEGAQYKNLYCTYLHGPVLARNPNLVRSMLIKALENKYPHQDLSKQKQIKFKVSY